MPLITHVAVRFRGTTYSLPAPNRHHHVLWMIAEQTGAPFVDGQQGFLDDTGAFLNRVEALALARQNGQLLDATKVRAERLFSEDLW